VILFVGEATNRAGDGRWLHIYLLARALEEGPLYRRNPRAWLRQTLKGEHGWLARRLVVSQQVNLLPEWPGGDARGSKFPVREARSWAAVLAVSIAHDYSFDDSRVSLATRVVLVGKRVAGAFDAAVFPYFTGYRIVHVGLPAMTFPHPSGVNHYWNAPGSAGNALRALESFLQVPPGEDF